MYFIRVLLIEIMPFKNKEQAKEYDRQRYIKNKEKMKQKGKEHYEENRQQKLEYQKEYREKNKEKIKEVAQRYNQTEKAKRRGRICAWKARGLVSEDYDSIYDRYINTHECDCCKKPITTGRGSRVMDHCHKTGKFRNILCHDCNMLRYHLDNNYQSYLRMMTL